MQTSDSEIQLIRDDWLAAVTRKDDHWEWQVVGFRAGHPVHPGMGEDTTVDACITAAEVRLVTLAPNPRPMVWERSNGMMIGHPYKSARPSETRPDSE